MNVSTGYKDAVANAIKTALDYGVIHLFSGAKPASPDDAEAGSFSPSSLTTGEHSPPELKPTASDSGLLQMVC